MLGGIEHDSDGVHCFGEVMTPEGIVSMVHWRHPDGRRFSATGDSLTTALAMGVQMEKNRLEAESSPVVVVTHGAAYEIITPSTCPKCGAEHAVFKTKDGEACMCCPHLEPAP